MNHNHYNKRLKNFANKNRNNMTKSEACLWKLVLSRRQMMGYKFKRQRPIGNYIADFVCLPLGLVIEVDGITHLNEKARAKDKQRDEDLKSIGFTTLRFNALDVFNKIDEIGLSISLWIEENAACPPPKARKQRVRRKQLLK